VKSFLQIKDGALVESTQEDRSIVIYVSPDEGEKRELFETLGYDWHDLESALDPDEISRLEFGPEDVFIIWKRPKNVSAEQQLKFEESSVGLFLQKNRLTVILGEAGPLFAGKELQKIGSLNGVLLKFFLDTVRHHLGHLKAIKQLTADLQVKLNLSMENRYFLQMFALSESLIYYLNAIEANSSVLAKLRVNADKVGFSKEEVEMLDDIIIEHQQCTRQAQIYSSVLSGLMDARGNIINNNMNVLLKNLTLINVVFLPLNLIASIGGMSEFGMMTSNIHWKVSYSIFVIAMAILGWATWIVLVRQIDRKRRIESRKNFDR
jgi:magnesium transporter